MNRQAGGPNPSPSQPVERLPLDERSPWWGEHRSRYRLALSFAPGTAVLDVACGTGYGSLMLADAGARFVAGCDVAPEALQAAERARFAHTVMYTAASGDALPFADATFDLVVSFETLEHVADGDAFVGELRRVLSPGGTLLLSTPNADVTRHYPPNPFHLREYTAAELTALLRRRFEQVTVRGQRPNERYAVAPFLPGHDRAEGLLGRVQLVLWKLLRRMPRAVGGAASRAILRRALYPSEFDYEFDLDTEGAHVLVARCSI